MELQNIVINNILNYMDSIKIEIKDDNRIKIYSKYLSKLTDISEKRLENILDIRKKRKIRLGEIEKICNALNIEMYKIFKR